MTASSPATNGAATTPSFLNHDWNGDGVLSGGEVRPDGRGPDDLVSGERLRGRFKDHDHNNDGVDLPPRMAR